MLSNVTAKKDPVVVPNIMLAVSANSSNPSHMPGNAVDGDMNTIWHSEWTPENAPFPHIFTIELCKKITLNTISIFPRQDADAGKITSGQIYVGDSLDNMAMVAHFTGDAGKSATVIDLKQIAAKYIQIYSLSATSLNTAISEINITTFDSQIITAFSKYYEAAELLRKSNPGTNVGEYLQTDIEEFKKELDDFYTELDNKDLSDSDYLDISDKLSAAIKAFSSKAKTYDKADLGFYIRYLSQLTGEAFIAEDKQAAKDLLEKANDIYSSLNTMPEEIHNIIVQLLDFINSIKAADRNVCDLSGEWDLALNDHSENMCFSDKVKLPGTLDTNKKGSYNHSNDINRLSRLYKYKGPAAYQKNIYISNKLAQKCILLYMERSRETRVWVNGMKVESADTSDILTVSQSYDISEKLNFGQYNTITIVVDNSYTRLPTVPICASHIATDETQTNWNGVIGKFELRINDKVYINDLRIYPNSDLISVKAEADIKNSSDSDYSGILTFSCSDAASRKLNINLAAGESRTVTVSDYAMPSDVRLWSEFDPATYKMTVSIDNGCVVERSFGMRVFSKDKDNDLCSLNINGKKVFLRNETNCAVFPITGHAPMDEESWKRLFKVYKSYGINSVRFHSWCPPEAAFCAADKMGIYLQPELSCWDGWMFDNDAKKDYYSREAYAILKEYASHPSFVMLSFGNELGYQDENYQYADKLIQGLKQKDSTRLYAAGSNIGFGGIDPAPDSDFFTAQNFANEPLRGSYGGLTGFVNENYPSSEINYNDTVKKVFDFNVPVFSFEVGQYQVFPDVLTETKKYTGVLDARNFKMISEKIKQKKLSDEEVSAAINASGMLSRIAYKAEIEAALRTKGMSGISLLGIQDFSGQGTALVGMMNALGEPKPYDFASPDRFISFFNPVTVLFETPKFCYTNKESLTGNILLSNYSQSDIQERISYRLFCKGGIALFEGKTDVICFKQGELTAAAQISVQLGDIKVPTQLKLEISCLQSKNSYNIWVYPECIPDDAGEVCVTDHLDDTAINFLKNGGKVFISPGSLESSFPNSIRGIFTTAFWSTYDRSQPGTMGLLVDPEHPLFNAFPTDYHSDYQWWAMSKYGRPMNLENFRDKEGKKIRPLIKVLDGFENLNSLGLLYEARVGEGKIMVSSMDLENLKNKYIEAAALRASIIRYMNSDYFDPQPEIDIEQIYDQIKK